jgi:glycosyltransferase involved in cell wall biosynthesis
MKSQCTQITITAVIVLYRLLPSDSITFQTLQKAYSETRPTGLKLQLLLYDNTPGGQDPGELPEGIEYFAAPQNEGLAAAYNWAVERAVENHSEWLLTLDQDTGLPENFLLEMGLVAAQVADNPMVAAIVPQILSEGRTLSPNFFRRGAMPVWFPFGYHGIPEEDTYAFNSAAFLRISALKQVGGYHPWFWLDNSDALMFRQLHRHGKRVFVAGEVRVEHDFSMLNMKNRVSTKRYFNILLAESAFWDLEMNFAAGWERTARLLVRLAKHIRNGDKGEQRSITAEFLKRRLFWTRRRRLEDWERETQKLFPALPPFSSSPSSYFSKGRPKITVCMAAYNGAAYIELQLRSILQQLSASDEVVIVDDASTDATMEVIQGVQSPLIRLIHHDKNRGVVQTFEDALRSATGDILFLADGDDIWAANKVEQFLRGFRANPNAKLITSRVSFIDEHGAPTESDMYHNRKIFQWKFWPNVLCNHFQGSAMAFRASLLHAVLPFPKRVGFLHDQWIGTVNARMGTSAVCLEEPLLFYRRHPHNLSKRMSPLRRLQVRLQLLRAHLFKRLR